MVRDSKSCFPQFQSKTPSTSGRNCSTAPTQRQSCKAVNKGLLRSYGTKTWSSGISPGGFFSAAQPDVTTSACYIDRQLYRCNSSSSFFTRLTSDENCSGF